MDRLTEGGGTWPEQEIVSAWLKKHAISVPFSQQLELQESLTKLRQSLSQEAAREEVLEEACQAMEIFADGKIVIQAKAAIRALKREPNAATQDRSTERASGERTSAGTSPSPAPAAPDVEGMVKRLKSLHEPHWPQVEPPYGPCDCTCGLVARQAAALLAKIGQDSVDAARYRHWRNAKVGEASHDYHFDGLLGKIENACDLAHEIDAAIDADMHRFPLPPGASDE